MFGHLQAKTVASEVERGRLSSETRCRSFSSGNKANRASGSTIADDPQQQEAQSCFWCPSGFEERSRRETSVEYTHHKATTGSFVSLVALLLPERYLPDKQRSTTNVLASD